MLQLSWQTHACTCFFAKNRIAAFLNPSCKVNIPEETKSTTDTAVSNMFPYLKARQSKTSVTMKREQNIMRLFMQIYRGKMCENHETKNLAGSANQHSVMWSTSEWHTYYPPPKRVTTFQFLSIFFWVNLGLQRCESERCASHFFMARDRTSRCCIKRLRNMFCFELRQLSCRTSP